MKKIVSVLLIIFLLVISTVPSFAAKSVSFTVSDAEVFAGDEFTVDIFISDNSQLKMATLLINYDKNKLQYLDYNVGAIVPSSSNPIAFKETKDGIQIDYNDSSSTLSSAGKLVSLTFVSNDSAVGNTEIKLSANGGKINTKSGYVTPTFKDGKINIINNIVTTLPITSTTFQETDSQTSETISELSSTLSPSQGTSENTPKPSNPENDETVSDKNKDNKTQIIIAAAVVVAVVVSIALFDSNNNHKKKKRRKKKKSRR